MTTKQVNVNELDFTKKLDTNILFPHYWGSETAYKFGNIHLSEGVFEIAEETETFWFIDVIMSHQGTLKNEEFQCWKLEREMEIDSNGDVQGRTDVFKAICEDGNLNIIKKQTLPFSTFPFDSYTVWFENGVIYLPSER